LHSTGEKLSELVPGFTDKILIGVPSRVGGFRLLRWRSDATAPEEIANLADFFALHPDATGQLFAGLTYAEIGPTETILWLGEINSGTTTPVALDTSSFAWHTSDGGRLAFLAETEIGSLELVTLGPSGRDRAVGQVPSGSLAAWGNWGFAIRIPSGFTTTEIRNSDLEELAQIPGSLVGVMPDQRLVFTYGYGYPTMEDSGPVSFLVDPELGEIEPFSWVQPDEVLLEMAWAPTKHLVALHVAPKDSIVEGPFLAGLLRILSVDGEQLVELPTSLGVEPISWSSNGRFVIFPRPANKGGFELVVYDTEDRQITVVRTEAFDTPSRFPTQLVSLPAG
jgi:hypothetical protein